MGKFSQFNAARASQIATMLQNKYQTVTHSA